MLWVKDHLHVIALLWAITRISNLQVKITSSIWGKIPNSNVFASKVNSKHIARWSCENNWRKFWKKCLYSRKSSDNQAIRNNKTVDLFFNAQPMRLKAFSILFLNRNLTSSYHTLTDKRVIESKSRVPCK